jgi:hypothetical protein
MGWAYSPELGKSLTVQALLNHSVIGEAVADSYRPDLAGVGLGDGNCGYSITFYNKIDPIYLPFVAVKPEGSDLEFPRSTISGYSDFFSRLYQRFPATGRHRSVLGGLWTDRIDAAAVLKGRCEIGMISPEIEQKLFRFIHSGLLILDDVAQVSPKPARRNDRNEKGTPHLVASNNGYVELMKSVLEARSVLDLLRAIFEDHPLVLCPKQMGPEQHLYQPSALEALQSPAESLAIIVPLGSGEVELDVVRDSHLFPEFTANGQSRWADTGGDSFIELARRSHGMIDRYKVAPGGAALIGPGLIHNVRGGADCGGLRAVCVPSRQTPAKAVVGGGGTTVVDLDSGARILV